MPVTVTELFESRRVTTGANATAELRYAVSGTDDDTEARLELLASTDPTFDLYGDSALLLNREYVGIEPIGPYSWLGVAYYARVRATGQQRFRFDTRGGTQHITNSLGTIARYALPGETAPNCKGAIGQGDSGPEGVDITVPVFNFEVQRFIPNASITPHYLGLLYSLTGHVSNDVFSITLPNGEALIFSANEVLFMGAAGAQREGIGDWDVSFGFAASPNVTDKTIGDIIEIAKKGWEYLWVRFREAQDAGTGFVVQIPESVHIEKIYEFGDLSLLGIV
jgi:hypothetical protein